MKIEAIITGLDQSDKRSIARAITVVENSSQGSDEILAHLDKKKIDNSLILGITGPPGAGKSTLTNGIIDSFKKANKKVGVIAIDPSSSISGGAILGDRIRMMEHALDESVIIRSMATRGRLGGLCANVSAVTRIMAHTGCNPIIIETVGVGQSEMDVVSIADLTLMVLAPGLGDEIQAMKAGLLEVCDFIAINKSDLSGADILRMEMESVASGGSNEKRDRIFSTVATTFDGIKELIEKVLELAKLHKQNDEFEKRRTKAKKAEIVDWCLEMLRKKIESKVIDGQSDQLFLKRDAKILATEIIKKIVK